VVDLLIRTIGRAVSDRREDVLDRAEGGRGYRDAGGAPLNWSSAVRAAARVVIVRNAFERCAAGHGEGQVRAAAELALRCDACARAPHGMGNPPPTPGAGTLDAESPKPRSTHDIEVRRPGSLAVANGTPLSVADSQPGEPIFAEGLAKTGRAVTVCVESKT